MAPTYRARLRLEGLVLAGCGALGGAVLLLFVPESHRWPLNTVGQLAVFALALGTLGLRSVRRTLVDARELPAGGEGSGEPTPLWQLPLIVGGLTALVGAPGGWDAGLRVAGGCLLAGLWQAFAVERVVAREERRSGRTFLRARGSRLLGGTRLGFSRQG